jgi:isopenicillin-N N-acyltransferase-like protein
MAGWSWRDVVEHAMQYEEPVASTFPHLLDEVAGIAEGAGLAYGDVLALNTRTEVMNLSFARRALECSAFAAQGAATVDGHVLIGENWDWLTQTTDTVVVLETPTLTSVVEAGLLAKTGVGAGGVALVTNALVSDADRGEPGLPYHVLLRAALDAASLEEVIELLVRGPRASSANYLVADPAGAANVETAPGGLEQAWITRPEAGLLVHTNHYVCETTGLRDVGLDLGPHTVSRRNRLTRMLEDGHGRLDIEHVQDALRDHEHRPRSVCRHVEEELHPLEATATVASVVYDVTAREAWVTDGPPCSASFRPLPWPGR